MLSFLQELAALRDELPCQSNFPIEPPRDEVASNGQLFGRDGQSSGESQASQASQASPSAHTELADPDSISAIFRF
jgi:hypothetical protein